MGKIEIPSIPDNCEHNAHMFYIKAHDLDERTDLINYLKKNDVMCVFHYIPLHSSPAGVKTGYFHGDDIFTTRESEKLLRLPMYFGMGEGKVAEVVSLIYKFYEK